MHVDATTWWITFFLTTEEKCDLIYLFMTINKPNWTLKTLMVMGVGDSASAKYDFLTC